MTVIIVLTIGSALCLGALLVIDRPRELKHQSVVKARRVLDGKTLIVSRGTRCYTIRLEAIDSPELHENGGMEALDALAELVGSAPVLVEIHKKDRFGRIIATLFVKNRRATEWVNVNARLIAEGHACVYREYARHLSLERRQELNHLEQRARARRLGRWQAHTATDEPGLRETA